MLIGQININVDIRYSDIQGPTVHAVVILSFDGLTKSQKLNMDTVDYKH